MEFSGKTALVTGASSGIGRAIALELARHDAELHLVGRSLRALERVAETAGAAGRRAWCHQADLASEAEIDELVSHLGHAVTRLDMLVHSAGVASLGRIEEFDREAFDHLFRVNVRAPFLLTQGLLPLVRKHMGQVIFVNSSLISSPRAEIGPYAATKCALKAIADSLRAEVNGDGVRVVSIYPGCTASPMQAMLHEAYAKAYRPDRLLQPQSIAKTLVSALQLPHDAEVTDINIRPYQKAEACTS